MKVLPKILVVCAILTLGVFGSGTASAATVSVEELDASGRVFGTFSGGIFTWKDGEFEDITPAGAKNVSTDRLLPDGALCGSYTDSDNTQHAYIWREGTLTDIPLPDAIGGFSKENNSSNPQISFVSPTGRVFGTFKTPIPNPRGGVLYITKSFSWKDGVYSGLVPENFSSANIIKITPSGRVLGTVNDGTNDIPFTWFEGEFHNIEPTGAVTTIASDINNAGLIVGSFKDATGHHHAFTWVDGTSTDISPPDGSESSAYRANENGLVAGYSTFSPGGGTSGIFTWFNGAYTHFTPPSAWQYLLINSLNAAGEVVGTFQDAPWNEDPKFHLYTFKAGTFTDVTPAGVLDLTIDSLDDSGNIRGSFEPDGTFTQPCPFISSNGAFANLRPPNTAYCYVRPTGSLSGRVIGSYGASDDQFLGFTWADGVRTDLTPSGATSCIPREINESGRIIGEYRTSSGPNFQPLPTIAARSGIAYPDGAFTWADGSFVSLLPSGATAGIATKIDNAGFIVGTFVDSSGIEHAFRWKDGSLSIPSLPGAISMASTSFLNEAGQFVGYYTEATSQELRMFFVNSDGSAVPIALPSPDPSSGDEQTFQTNSSAGNAQLHIAAHGPLKTDKSNFLLTGTASGSVSYRVGKGRWQTVAAGGAWRIKVRLKHGKNVITIIAHGATGASKSQRLVIDRE